MTVFVGARKLDLSLTPQLQGSPLGNQMFRRKVFPLEMGWCVDLEGTSGLVLGPSLHEEVALQVMAVVFPVLTAPSLLFHPLHRAPGLPLLEQLLHPRIDGLVLVRHSLDGRLLWAI